MSQNYRLDGIYPQRQENYFMQRVKLPGGVISSEQALQVAHIAKRYGKNAIHLTTRGSMEIHWLTEENLAAVKTSLAKVGLTSRGACGGAVRGISCSSGIGGTSTAIERVARRIQSHFTGNPRFERLPKKFKISVESDPSQRRHLIQDAGLLLRSENETGVFFDLYVAGGLGKEPQPGFLLEQNVPEERIIPLLEAIATVYTLKTAAGKRLKHLIREIGEDSFRKELSALPQATESVPKITELSPNFTDQNLNHLVTVKVESGELSGEELIKIAEYAKVSSNSTLFVTTNQDIALPVLAESISATEVSLQKLGFNLKGFPFRVCPGSHSCKMGLSPTRQVAKQLAELFTTNDTNITFAISGCANSCTQPQLADVGIITSGLVKGEDGVRTPVFDLYRAGDDTFGSLVAHKLTLHQLLSQVKQINCDALAICHSGRL